MGDSAQGGQERGAHDRVLFHHCGEVGGTRKGVFVKQKKKKWTNYRDKGVALYKSPIPLRHVIDCHGLQAVC